MANNQRKPYDTLDPIRALWTYQTSGGGAPPAPTGLVATPGDDEVALTWTPVTGATYKVKRSDVPGGPYTVIATPAAANHTDNTVDNGFTYYYVVVAVAGGFDSPDSSEVSAIPNIALLKDDGMQAVGFTVPLTTTVDVSGGGAALQTAINAAASGTRLRITDSLAYDPITFTSKTDIGVWVAAGETPSITATPGSGGHCVTIGAGSSGIYLKGLAFIGSANENNLSQQSNGLVWGYNGFSGMATFDRLIVEDCTFSEPAPATSGVPGIQLGGTNGSVHQDVWVHRCTFQNQAAGVNATTFGYGACTIAGFTNVFVQNCKIIRTNAVIARASSHMRGVVCKSINVWVENVLCEDIGSAGSNEAFKHNDEAIFGTAVGVSNWRNNVAYNCKRGYRLSLAAATMNVIGDVFHNDVAGIAASQVIARRDQGTYLFRNSIIAGAGDGTAFSATGVTEDHNDIFSVAAPGKTLDVTDLLVDPQFFDVSSRNFDAQDTQVRTQGSDGGPMGVRYALAGEDIIWAVAS